MTALWTVIVLLSVIVAVDSLAVIALARLTPDRIDARVNNPEPVDAHSVRGRFQERLWPGHPHPGNPGRDRAGS